MANFHYRLLVIDDEPLSRELLQSSLSTHGYEVGVAKDGFAALAQMRGALPDLIVTDLKMPNMSGFEFCHYLSPFLWQDSSSATPRKVAALPGLSAPLACAP
jgi:CheY-like chemotaxis protein